MPQPTFPTAQHIEIVLKSNSIWPTNENLQKFARFQAGITAEAAQDQFENLTGWLPALAPRNENGELIPETRYFGADDLNHLGDLNLKGGLLRLDSVALSGTVQTRDYTPFLHYFRTKKEKTAVSIRNFSWGGYGYNGAFGGAYGGNTIAITGVWGLFSEVPKDVFEVCQHKAIANMMDYVYNQQSIGSISQDGFSESFDITGVRTQQNIAETGAKGFNTLCQNYARPIY